MSILLNAVLLFVGFFLLIKGADWFVDGAAALAKKLKVPGVIIGLTVVAMGTSAPELAVSVTSAIDRANGLCLGNVIGSNLFNLLMVLGVCAVIRPIAVEQGILKRDFPFSIAMTIITVFFAGVMFLFSPEAKGAAFSAPAGKLTQFNGAMLLVFFAIYLAITIFVALKNREEGDEIESMPLVKSIGLLIVGICCIVFGGDTVVNNAKELAIFFGMSETLVGLTIVAIGTSLPELVTSIVASSKGQNDMAVGNVVGSNIFNLLLILGTSSLINPITIALESVIDLIILIVVSFAVYIFCVSRKKLSKPEGMVMVFVYVAYTAFAIIRCYM